MKLKPSSPSSRLRSGGISRSLLTAAVLAGPPVMTAQAAIIYSGIQNLLVGPPFPGGAPQRTINIDNAGPAEFTLVASATQGKVGTIYSLSLSIDVSSTFDFVGNTGLSLLGASNSIGAGSAFSLLSNVTVSTTAGWAGGTSGYFGFRFNPTGSQPLYGWALLTISSARSGMTLVDWAYDNSGASINATVRVPEPGLAMLALAGITGAGFRRRRAVAISI